MKINPIGHLVKTNPNKPNFRQEIPKMPYLPAFRNWLMQTGLRSKPNPA